MAARSVGEYSFEKRLKALNRTGCENDTLSTGKLLSNMHRSGPNASIHGVMTDAISLASSSEPIGLSRVYQSKPMRGMPMPPSFRKTLGQAATSARPFFQAGST